MTQPNDAIVEAAQALQDYMEQAMGFISAPHVRMRASVFPDGDKWCCLHGDDLQVGVAGFGDTPAEACAAFDRAWWTERTPAALTAPVEGS